MLKTTHFVHVYAVEVYSDKFCYLFYKVDRCGKINCAIELWFFGKTLRTHSGQKNVLEAQAMPHFSEK